MPETTEYEEYLSEDSFVFTLINNKGIFAFCPEKVVLIETDSSKDGFTLKTSKKDNVQLGEIRENGPPQGINREVEDREVETQTEIILQTKNQSLQGFVEEDVETVAKCWLETVNGYLEQTD